MLRALFTLEDPRDGPPHFHPGPAATQGTRHLPAVQWRQRLDWLVLLRPWGAQNFVAQARRSELLQETASHVS